MGYSTKNFKEIAIMSKGYRSLNQYFSKNYFLGSYLDFKNLPNLNALCHFENMGSDISPHYGTSSGKWKHSFFYHPDQEKKC